MQNPPEQNERIVKKRDKKATREKILEVALELFSTRGFNGVSIRDITKTVGINESSLYNHFDGKEDLLNTILEYLRTELEKARALEGNFEDLIESIPLEAMLYERHMKFKKYVDTPVMAKIYRLLITEQFTNEKAGKIILDLFYKEPLARFETYFKTLLKKKLIKNYDPHALAVEFLYAQYALISEYSLARCYNQDTEIIEQRMKGHIELFCNLIKKGV